MNGMLHFKSADYPWNDKGIGKVAGEITLKTLRVGLKNIRKVYWKSSQ